jgi:hypothetical protein
MKEYAVTLTNTIDTLYLVKAISKEAALKTFNLTKPHLTAGMGVAEPDEEGMSEETVLAVDNQNEVIMHQPFQLADLVDYKGESNWDYEVTEVVLAKHI